MIPRIYGNSNSSFAKRNRARISHEKQLIKDSGLDEAGLLLAAEVAACSLDTADEMETSAALTVLEAAGVRFEIRPGSMQEVETADLF